MEWPPWPLIGWDISHFSSETAERNWTKLYRKQDLNVLFQVCVFGPIGKTRWLPWLLIAWDIFDFSSETAERNLMKLDKKQDFNVLYQVCVFRADRKNKMAALASDWLRHFRHLLWNRWTACKETYRKKDFNVLYQVCVFWDDRKNKMPPWPIRQKGGTFYSGAWFVALWASCNIPKCSIFRSVFLKIDQRPQTNFDLQKFIISCFQTEDIRNVIKLPTYFVIGFERCSK